MKMSRTTLVIIALALLFSLVAFAVPFEKNLLFLAAYLFGMVAILMQLYFLKSAFQPGGPARSRVYGFPVARIGIIYLAMQLLASLGEMSLSGIAPLWTGLVVNAVIFVLAMAGCFATEVAREEVVKQDVALKDTTSIVGGLTARAQALQVRCKDEVVKKELGQLADALRYSDPVSSEATADIEKHIESLIERLAALIDKGKNAEALKTMAAIRDDVRERNLICRANK